VLTHAALNQLDKGVNLKVKHGSGSDEYRGTRKTGEVGSEVKERIGVGSSSFQ